MSHEIFQREEVLWTAGLFEGEGNVRGTSTQNSHALYLRIGMNDFAPLKRACDAIGGRVIERTPDGHPKSCRYVLVLAAHTAYAAGIAMYPFICGEKRAQLADALRVWVGRRPRRPNQIQRSRNVAYQRERNTP